MLWKILNVDSEIKLAVTHFYITSNLHSVADCLLGVDCSVGSSSIKKQITSWIHNPHFFNCQHLKNYNLLHLSSSKRSKVSTSIYFPMFIPFQRYVKREFARNLIWFRRSSVCRISRLLIWIKTSLKICFSESNNYAKLAWKLGLIKFQVLQSF